MKFMDLWADYRTWLLVDAQARPATVAEYGSVLRRWDRWLSRHHLTWEQAGRADLDRFLGRKATRGQRKGQPLSINRRRTDAVAAALLMAGGLA